LFSLSLTTLFARAVVLLTALPVHEAAHAYAAEKMGDSTARYSHRLTLNPLDHTDPLGAVMLLLFGVGFAKPVPVNSANFRDRKKGMFVTSIAGPLSNVGMAWLAMILCKLMTIVYYATSFSLARGAANVFAIMLMTNLSLAVFNLIPIPPLDGWHALMPFLSYETVYKVSRYEQYLVWVLLALLWLGVFDTPISFLTGLLYRLMDTTTFFMDFLLRVVL
jgi:Zn-dependent protease